MKCKLSQPWNMAQVRSRQAPRVTKMHGPVGEKHFETVRCGAFHAGTTCAGCGYHCCSCELTPLFGIEANAGDVWETATRSVPPKPEPREYNTQAAQAVDASIKALSGYVIRMTCCLCQTCQGLHAHPIGLPR